MRKAKIAAISAEQDSWMRRAVDASIAAAMDVLGDTGPIRPGTPIGRLTSHEWGWICSAVVWAWIATRAEQAASEGWDHERAIRATGLSPDPWDAGAIASILSKLAEALSDFGWSQPIGAWSKDTITEFLAAAFALCIRAIAARDATEERAAGKTGADVTARRMNAAAGNPRMTVAELNDESTPPF
jgi:hypothetical protein